MGEWHVFLCHNCTNMDEHSHIHARTLVVVLENAEYYHLIYNLALDFIFIKISASSEVLVFRIFIYVWFSFPHFLYWIEINLYEIKIVFQVIKALSQQCIREQKSQQYHFYRKFITIFSFHRSDIQLYMTVSPTMYGWLDIQMTNTSS